MILHAMAVEFRLAIGILGRREHDSSACYARDAVVGGAQVNDCGSIVSSVRRSLTVARVR